MVRDAARLVWLRRMKNKMNKVTNKYHKRVYEIPDWCIKLKNVTDVAAILGIMYILLYRINSLKKICMAVGYYAIELTGNTISKQTIIFLYGIGECIVINIIMLSVVLTAIFYIFKKVNDRLLLNLKGENRFQESMFRYLNDTKTSHCFLISGKWGTGKTYDTSEFFRKYYSFSNYEIYRISCFGLSTRQQVVEEINNVIEQNDNSFSKKILNIIKHLPVIGELIFNLFSKNYSYKHIDKKSIFVFDDFERITYASEGMGDFYEASIRVAHRNLYSKHSFDMKDMEMSEELDRIRKEFLNVEDGFRKVNYVLDGISLHEDYNKYIAIVGLMNELIEYKYKVIILCNIGMIGERFVRNVLKDKLNCIEYKKILNYPVYADIIENLIQKKNYNKSESETIVVNFMREMKECINNIEINNLRTFSAFIESFMDTAILFDKRNLNNEFLNSLLNSIMIEHMNYSKKGILKTMRFVNGANIDFQLKINETPIINELICVNIERSRIRWVDGEISGYWIYNLPQPQNVNEIYDDWIKYKYYMLENEMLSNINAIDLHDYTLIHILYYQKEIGDENYIGDKYIDNILGHIENWNDNVVKNILSQIQLVLCDKIYTRFNNHIFSEIVKKNGEREILDIDGPVVNEYNRYVYDMRAGR